MRHNFKGYDDTLIRAAVVHARFEEAVRKLRNDPAASKRFVENMESLMRDVDEHDSDNTESPDDADVRDTR